jgi:hypothetical protein
MEDRCFATSRSRLFIGVLGALLLVSAHGAYAGEGNDNNTVSVVTVVPGPGSGSGSSGKSKPPSQKVKAAAARVNRCPVSAVNAPEGRFIDGGAEGIGMYQAHQCNPETGWVTRFVCYERCPEGVVKGFTPPPAPSLEELYIAIHRSIPAPDPLFAPPVDKGNGIAAIVGKRLYVNLSTSSFEEKDGSYDWGGGYWYATVVLEPTSYSFTDGTQGAAACTANAASARTIEGRKVLDAQGCSIVINNKPPGGRLPVTITSKWTAYITSNIPNAPASTGLQSSTVYPVLVNEVQSIIAG